MAEQMIAAAAAEARARARVDAQEIIATAQAERGREESELHLHRQPELGALVMEAQHLRVEIDRISHLDRQYHGALQALLAVRLYPRCRVVEVDGAAGVRLADGTVLTGDRVVVAVGPSSRDLLPAPAAAELTLYRQSMLSYAPTPSRQAWAGMPVIPAIGTPEGAWLMPPVAGTSVRLSASTACRQVTGMTGHTAPDHWHQFLVDQFADLIADFDPAAVVGASDGYYLSAPGGGPLLGALDDAWVYAACGGMSFKIAPLVARALADRAIGRRPRRTGLAAVDHPMQFTAGAAGRAAGASPLPEMRPR
jgi:glycine/D-amino acid oxidase-like deaminating enzyme